MTKTTKAKVKKPEFNGTFTICYADGREELVDNTASRAHAKLIHKLADGCLGQLNRKTIPDPRLAFDVVTHMLARCARTIYGPHTKPGYQDLDDEFQDRLYDLIEEFDEIVEEDD